MTITRSCIAGINRSENEKQKVKMKNKKWIIKEMLDDNEIKNFNKEVIGQKIKKGDIVIENPYPNIIRLRAKYSKPKKFIAEQFDYGSVFVGLMAGQDKSFLKRQGKRSKKRHYKQVAHTQLEKIDFLSD